MATNRSMPSVMQHAFSKIPSPSIQRSSFDRSKGVKTTFDTGYLIPVYVDEILPGDTVNMKATFFARIATLLFPIMDNVFFDTFWFFCPNRLLWNNWERFNGAQDDPGDSIDFEIPFLSGDPIQFSAYSIGDYFGIPTGVNLDIDSCNALPFRMYNLVYNVWFRDQNLQNSLPKNIGDGPDPIADYDIVRRGKRHDYFTSCLPWPQKGDAVSIPLGTSAPVIGDGTSIGFNDLGTASPNKYLNVNDNAGFSGSLGVSTSPGLSGAAAVVSAAAGDRYLSLNSDPALSHVFADLSQATSATINQLREAFAVQQLLERDARGGTRYTEILQSHFGVHPADFRLQRPEYLGGSSQRLDVRSVAQTSETAATPQANLAAYGSVADQSGFVKSFDEHGYLMCIVNVRGDISYQQGMHRMWSRKTRYDFYLPVLAHLGEQPVLNKEIFYAASQAQNIAVFGYNERWAEYRYGNSQVTGAFRSNIAASLDAWHLALEFGALPVLDDGTFIQDNPPISRITALDEGTFEGQQILLDCYFSTRWARPMPVYSVPGLERL